MNQLMTEGFVEQPLASPGSANKFTRSNTVFLLLIRLEGGRSFSYSLLFSSTADLMRGVFPLSRLESFLEAYDRVVRHLVLGTPLEEQEDLQDVGALLSPGREQGP